MPPSVIHVRTYRFDGPISREQIALTRDVFTRVQLRDLLSGWLKTKPATKTHSLGTPTSPFPFLDYIDKYSEPVVENPVADMEKFFKASGLASGTVGGIPTGSTILNYKPKAQRLPRDAISAIGEALAGWYLEVVEGLDCQFRPIGVSPDLFFREPNRGRFALAEVKTLKTGVLNTKLKEAALVSLDILAKTKLIRSGRYLAFAVGVVIRAIDEYEIHVLRMEEV